MTSQLLRTNIEAHLTGILLVAAFVVFLIGAGFWLVREFEQPLPAMLRAAYAHRRRWIWIHLWMFAGTMVSIFAVASLVRLMRADGGGLLATVGLSWFAVGCVAFLISLAIRLATTLRAAEETIRTNVVPAHYQKPHRIADGLYFGYMLLSYATFAALGAAMLRGSILPSWVGWTGIASGVVSLVGFTLLRGGPFAPPIIAHAFGLLVGIVLLLR